MNQSIRMAGLAMFTCLLATGVSHADSLNLNEADAETLAETLDGVGESRAAAIVEYRESNGGFDSVDELVEVPGIGEATVSSNADRVSVESD